MGMSIEEIQQCLKEYHSGFTGYAGNFQEVVDGALDIMCKYQKIEEVVNTWRHDITAGDYHCMAEIAEVVEDENDD